MSKKTTNCASEACPVSVALDVFGGKWKLQIIWTLNEQSYRFGELKRELQGISEKILIQQLKQLVADGIVNRVQFHEVPPRVEYSLTERGVSLLPIFRELRAWSRKHLMTEQYEKEIKSRIKRANAPATFSIT